MTWHIHCYPWLGVAPRTWKAYLLLGAQGDERRRASLAALLAILEQKPGLSSAFKVRQGTKQAGCKARLSNLMCSCVE